MEEELHLLRQQALRTLPSPKKRTIAPSLLSHGPAPHQLESDFRINELLFREKVEQLPRRKRLSTPELSRKMIDDFASRTKGRHIGSPASRKRQHQARPMVHAKRRKRSISGSSSHSEYSSSSHSRSASRSSYSSSHSSSPSHSHSSRSSSHSSQSRSLSSRLSSSYSRSTFSSSSRSPSVSPKSRSKKAKVTRHQHDKPHRTLDRKIPSSAKRLRSPTLMPSRDWHADSLEYRRCKPKEESTHRRGILPREDMAIERNYRGNRRSQSPSRLGDKFVEYSRRPGHVHESSRRHYPPHSPTKERRIIRQVRQTSPPFENDRYARGRMRFAYSPPELRRRSRYSPPPQMRRRPRGYSLERLRRPIERSLGREERYKRLPNPRQKSRRRDEFGDGHHGDGHHRSSKGGRQLNSRGDTATTRMGRSGRSGTETDQEVKKRKEVSKDLGISGKEKQTTGETKNGVCKNKNLEPVRKEKEEHDPLQTEFEASDLLGDYEFDVELDYDENMEEIEGHPPESQKPEDDHKESALNLDNQQKTSTCGDAQSRSPTPGIVEHESSPSEDEGQVDEDEGGEKINSPIRVSPDRDRSKSKEVSSNKSLDGKLSVKERLYVSRQTIEEKRRTAVKTEPQTSLRPSLASRLGPSPHSRRRSDAFLRSKHSSRLRNKSSKGDAVAIAEAYRRKKRQEAIGLGKDEVRKAKKFTKIINEHGSSRTSRRKHVLEDVENDKDREEALDKRINEIKEQNRAILKRKREIEEDKELYG